MQLEGLVEVSEGQDWGGVHKTFKYIKGLLTFICPLNLSPFMSSIVSGDLIIKGVSSFEISLNKASILVCES